MQYGSELNGIFEGVCTVTDGDKIRVVTPFAHNDPEGAQRACDAFRAAKELGAPVSLRFWDFDYEGRAPEVEDFRPGWNTPRC